MAVGFDSYMRDGCVATITSEEAKFDMLMNFACSGLIFLYDG